MKKQKKAIKLCLENIEIQMKVVGEPALDTCRELMRHAKKERNEALIGLAHYYIARCYLERGEYDMVVQNMSEAIVRLDQTEDWDILARAYNILAVMAHGQNNLVLAVDYYMTAIRYCKGYELKTFKLYVMNNLADALFRMGDYDKAIQHYKSCVEDYRKIKKVDYWEEANYFLILSTYGYCLTVGERFEEAHKVEKELLEMMYYRPSAKIPGLPIYTFLATMQLYYKEHKKAEEYIDMAVEDVLASKNCTAQFDNILNLLSYLGDQKDTQRLEKVLNHLEPQVALEGNAGLLLQFLPYRMWYCTESFTREEYLAYVKEIFLLHQQCEKEEHKSILNAIELRTSIEELRKNNTHLHLNDESLITNMMYDQLTKLPNRAYFTRNVEKMFRDAGMQHKTFGVAIVDVDYFKKYRTKYGFLQSDKCIKQIADIISNQMRGIGFAARYSTDEFMLLFEDKSYAQILQVMREIRIRVQAARIPHEDSEFGVVSVTQAGISRVPVRDEKPWKFLAETDQALYYQKVHEKGNIHLTDKF